MAVSRVVLLTGSGGFVGRAVLRCADEFENLIMAPLARGSAAEEVLDTCRNYPDAQISLLNLAWPSLEKYSSAMIENVADDQEWRAYEEWVSSLVAVAAQEKIRFFQIGSGIEPFGLSDPPSVSGPYVDYAHRKNEIWRTVEASLPELSWRLRLHFLFGEGESNHRFVPTAIRASQAGRPMIVGSPERLRCWLDIDDAARGLLMAVLQTRPDNWDICGVNPVSFGELLTLIGELTGKGVEIAESECVVADAGCPVAVPTNVAPFMAHDVGSLYNLKNRLVNYAQTLSRT